MRTLPFLLLGLVACSHSPFPSAKFDPLPAALSNTPAGAVIEERQLSVEYSLDANNKPLATLEERARVRITGPEGVSFAHWPLPTDPHAHLTTALMRLTHPNGEAVQGEVKDSALVVPAAAPGDLVDVFIAHTSDLPEALPAMIAGDRAPTRVWHAKVSARDGCVVRVASGTDAAAVPLPPTSPGSHPRWEVTFNNLAMRDRAAPAATPGPFVVAVLNGYPLPDGSLKDVASTWDAVAAWIDEVGASSRPPDEGAAAALRQGVGRALLLRVRESMHPKSTPGLLDTMPRAFAALGKGQPATPLETAAVAAAVSAPTLEPARMALVARAENFPVLDALPGLYAFTDAMMAVRGEDRAWQFMDPMCESCGPGEVDFDRVGGRALVLAPNHPELARVPLTVGQLNRRRMQFDWTLNLDGTLQGTLLAELEGAAEKPVRAVLHGSDVSQDNRLATVQTLLWGQGPKVSGDATEVNHPYGVRMQVNTTSTTAGQALHLMPQALAGEGFVWRLPANGDVVLPGPLESETVCTVVLPAVKSVKLPEALILSGRWGSYNAHFEMQEHYMVYTQTLRLAARLLSDKDRADLAVAVAKIAAAQARPVLVRLED